MKTIRFFLPGFLILVCCAVGAAEPGDILSGTNVLLNIRASALSGILTDSPSRVRLRAALERRNGRPPLSPPLVRLSLDLAPARSSVQSWSDIMRIVTGSFPEVERTDTQGPSSSSSVEGAERINGEAMRRYRERWEELLRASRVQPAPVLYPSKVQEALEQAK